MASEAVTNRERDTSSSTAPAFTNLPLVSIAMPVLNEARYIEGTLAALLAQDYPPERTEIIISDGGSSDGTCERIQAVMRKHSCRRILLIHNPLRNPGSGMNKAIQVSNGDIILRMDGHAEPARDYVSQCVHALLTRDVDNVGGPIRAEGINYFSETVAIATTSLFGNGGAKFRYSAREELVDTVPFGAWRRELFGRVGLFIENVRASEDTEFNARIRKAGGKVLLSPAIKSTYHPRHSALALWKQYTKYGQMKWRVNPLHVPQMQLRHFAPAIFVASLLAGTLMTFFGDARFIIALGESYGAATFVVSLLLSAKKGWKYFLLLPPVFLILHLSYGFGSLAEMTRLATGWFAGRTLPTPVGPAYDSGRQFADRNPTS